LVSLENVVKSMFMLKSELLNRDPAVQ